MNGGYSPLRRWLREERAADFLAVLADDACASCGEQIGGGARWHTPEDTRLCVTCGLRRFGWRRSMNLYGGDRP